MQTFAEWEKYCGFMVKDVTPELLATKMSEEQFREYIKTNVPGGLPPGVQHEDRIKFLTDNGYEVNRANMVNTELHARPPEPEQPPEPAADPPVEPADTGQDMIN